MTAHQPAANFDAVARPYRWMEYATFGGALESCRFHFLAQLERCRSALVLGDGDGRFLARLLASNAELRVDAVDSSAAMLRLLEGRVGSGAEGDSARLRTHQVSALNFTPQRNYDLVVTHFFLDCLKQTEVESLCARVVAQLEPRALWVVSEFSVPAGAMRWPARVIVRLLYLAFRALTGLQTAELPNHATCLTAAGFERIAEHASLGGLLVSELWEYTPAMLPPQKPKVAHIPDPVPDPEPASPSLTEPDPGVFHHEPVAPAPCKTKEDPAPEE